MGRTAAVSADRAVWRALASQTLWSMRCTCNCAVLRALVSRTLCSARCKCNSMGSVGFVSLCKVWPAAMRFPGGLAAPLGAALASAEHKRSGLARPGAHACHARACMQRAIDAGVCTMVHVMASAPCNILPLTKLVPLPWLAFSLGHSPTGIIAKQPARCAHASISCALRL